MTGVAIKVVLPTEGIKFGIFARGDCTKCLTDHLAGRGLPVNMLRE